MFREMGWGWRLRVVIIPNISMGSSILTSPFFRQRFRASYEKNQRSRSRASRMR